mmetsp:Transcript_25296/g.70953  ORF Transcript_25296/g.70953 Transcript_25296/m.70953 type:complete len:356 (-) Transcript_25296:1069-2136(-)
MSSISRRERSSSASLRASSRSSISSRSSASMSSKFCFSCCSCSSRSALASASERSRASSFSRACFLASFSFRRRSSSSRRLCSSSSLRLSSSCRRRSFSRRLRSCSRWYSSDWRRFSSRSCRFFSRSSSRRSPRRRIAMTPQMNCFQRFLASQRPILDATFSIMVGSPLMRSSMAAALPARKNTRDSPIWKSAPPSRPMATRSASENIFGSSFAIVGITTSLYRAFRSVNKHRVGNPACMIRSASNIPLHRSCVITPFRCSRPGFICRFGLMHRMKCDFVVPSFSISPVRSAWNLFVIVWNRVFFCPFCDRPAMLFGPPFSGNNARSTFCSDRFTIAIRSAWIESLFFVIHPAVW